MDERIINISLAFLVNVAAIFIIAWKYKIIAGFVKENISVMHSISVFLVTQLMGFISPFKLTGIITKPFVTRYYTSIPLKKCGLIVVLEQLIEFASLPLTIVPLLIFMGWGAMAKLYAVWLVVGLSLISIIILLFYREIIAYILRFSRFFPGFLLALAKKLKINKRRISRYIKSASIYLSKKQHLARILPAIIVYIIFMPFIIYFLGQAYSFPISYASSFIAYWLSFTLGRISGLPGGIGVRDISLSGYLALLGMPAYDIISLVIVYRIITLFFPVVVGIPLIIKIGRLKLKEYHARHKTAN